MSEEEIRNIIYLKNKPISSYKDLHKYFIGRHNEPIIVYLTPKIEIEFENIFGKLEYLEKENKKYKEVINKAINYINNNIIGIDIKSDNIMLNRTELLDILKEVEHE